MKKIINKKHFNSFVALLVVGLMVIGSISIKSITASAASTRNYSATVNEGSNKTLNVTATADAEALEDGVTLKAKKITSQDDQYKSVKEKVEKENKNKKVSFLAYDIGFYKDGKEVEPNGEVKVNLSWNTAIAPTGTTNTDDISILHLKESDGKISKVDNITKDDDTKINTQTNKVKSATFTTDSFSVFTITWSVSDTDSTRFSYVNVNYVNESGLALDDPTSVPAGGSDLKSGGVVDLSKWANDGDNSRISGYTFKEARIGSRTKGTVITGLKAVADTDSDPKTYKLYYTTASDPSTTTEWTQYTDSTSGESANNANIYLIYTKDTVMTAPITVHYLDVSGNPLKDSNGKEITETFDVASLTATQNNGFTDMANSTNGFLKTINGYSFSTSNINGTGTSYIYVGTTDTSKTVTFTRKSTSGSTITASKVPDTTNGPILGSYFRFIKYDSTNGILVGRASGNENYTVTVSDDGTWGIYFRYAIADSLSVKVHQVDEDGNEIGTDTVSTSGGTLDLSSVTAPTGYTFNSGEYYYGYTDKSNKGTQFTSLSYTKGTNQWTSTKDSDTDPTSNLVTDVWMVYTADKTTSVVVHHVDTDGNEIDLTTSSTEKFSSGATLTADDYDKELANYTYDHAYFKNSSNDVTFTSMKFTYDSGTNKWSSVYNADGVNEQSTGSSVVKDVYLQYNQKTDGRNIVVHFVDQNGDPLVDNNGDVIASQVSSITVSQTTVAGWKNSSNTNGWNGWTLYPNNTSSNIKGITVPTGYSFVGEYLGKTFNDAHRSSTPTETHRIQYKYDSTYGWYTSSNLASAAATGSHVINSDGTPGETGVFHEYITDIYWVYTKNPITVHYVDSSGTALSGVSNKTISLTEGTTVDLTNSTYAIDVTNYSYTASRTDSVSGPQVTKVRLKNGDIQYLKTGSYDLTKQGNNARWSITSSAGGTYTLYYDSDSKSFRLYDSVNGSTKLSLSGTNTYSASVKTDTGTITYKVTPSTNETGRTVDTKSSYTLEVNEWTDSTSTNVYQIYVKDGTDGTIWIDDDLKYTGYFSLGMDSTVETKIKNNDWTDVWYEWHRVERTASWPMSDGSDDTIIDNYTSDNTVSRKQNGAYWNIAYASSDRTWLDVSADGGARTQNTEAGYYVELHYKDGDTDKSIKSAVAPVEYYAQLENGGFETPVSYENNAAVNGFAGSQTTNKNYKNRGGVWQSTAEAPDSNSVAIEIFNLAQRNSGIGAVWNGTPTAAEGEQFAELNAESAGALYQDVITNPGETLSYWFSHHARGNYPNSTPEYDTMYLVIMPTSQAMKAASDGGELTDQADLIDFINDQTNNAYSYNKPTAADYAETTGKAKILLNDESTGILIAKVTSSDQAWNAIRNINGYRAKGSLTRFFFVAGPTAWNGESGSRSAVLNATHGNLIDGIGYSTQASAGTGFNMTVKKTFSGLTNAQIAALSNGYKITLSDKYVVRSEGTNTESSNSSLANSALNGAKLSFTYTHAENSDVYTWKPTATLAGTDSKGNSTTIDLFNRDNNDSTGTAYVNEDGSVTLIWTFVNEDVTENEIYNYTADESGTAVSGKSLSASLSVSPQSGINSKAVEVEKGTQGQINLTNTYSNLSSSEVPELVVTKKFTGVTPTAVDQILASGFKITVTNANDSTKTTTLTGNAADLDSNVKMIEDDSDDSTTTYRWIISGWGTGTYKLSEQNYSTTAYTAIKATIDGTATENPSGTISKDSISVSSSDAATVSYSTDESLTKTITPTGSTFTGETLSNLNTSTNLIIAKYVSGGNKYLVWTRDAIGVKVAQAIVNKINKDLKASGESNVTLTDVVFRSGANPGELRISTNESNTDAMTYDSVSGAISFSGSSGNWTKLYSSVATGLDASDISVVNQYEPEIRVLKTDSSDATNVLSGAEFRLYKYDSGTKKYYTGSTWDDNESKAKTYTTNLNGINSEAMPKLDSNETYYLEETKAPDGYNLPAKYAVAINVSDTGVVTLVTDTSGLPEAEQDKVNTEAKLDWNNPYYTITVKNTAGVQLPWTGGSGTMLFTVLGIVLIVTAVCMIYKRRRKEEEE